MSEYGADTLEGLHFLPAFVWSEEFQTQLFSRHFEAFDRLRAEGFFIGEFVWNFADFKTIQSKFIFGFLSVFLIDITLDINRVGGNKKGVFTRSRQPKASAHLLRQRYFDLSSEIDDFKDQPKDLDEFISSLHQEKFYKDEL